MSSPAQSPTKVFHPAVFRVVGLYFASLVVLIFLTVVCKFKLYSRMEWFGFPTAWGWLLMAWFYVVPFIFGAGGGFLLKPFIRNFVVITALIFSFHSVYTFFAFSLRSGYLMTLEAEAQASRRSELSLKSLTHKYQDENGDGLVDRVAMVGHWELKTDSPGGYLAALYLVQNNRLVAGGSIGQQKLDMEAQGTRGFDFAFSINPVNIKDALSSGPVEVHLDLKKSIPVSGAGKSILAFCRWAPFLDRTGFEGEDPEIYQTLLSIVNFHRIDVLVLDPAEIQRDQVIFVRYINDVARDLDGNGLYDELLVSLLVDSIYSGPIYYSLQEESHPEIFFQNKTSIAKGADVIHLVIDGTDLKKLGKDGPYRLTNVNVLNNDPYCPSGKCDLKNLPVFTLYLPKYVTQAYELNKFE